jgi:hypothetical protein
MKTYIHKISITQGDNATIIAAREYAGRDEIPALAEGFSREEGRITRRQGEVCPYICANYKAGRFIGGSTLTEEAAQAAIAKARAAGCNIDELAWLKEEPGMAEARAALAALR